jgi:hypothetical protein
MGGGREGAFCVLMSLGRRVRAALCDHKPLAIWLQELFIPAGQDFIHEMFQDLLFKNSILISIFLAYLF